MSSVGSDPGIGDPVVEELHERLQALEHERDEVLVSLTLRRLEADQAAGELAGHASEAREDMIKARDALAAILPALVIAHERYEDRDGVLNESVLAVAETIGRLEAGASLLAGEVCPG